MQPASVKFALRRMRAEKKAECFGQHWCFGRWSKGIKVCLACTALGYSSREVHGYSCYGCGIRGHLKFSSHVLNYHKQHQTQMLCSDCTSRDRRIKKLLSATNSLRCTCPGRARRQQHLPGNQKCALYPRFAGEQRWPGQNKGVTREDFLFHERVAKRRKTFPIAERLPMMSLSSELPTCAAQSDA